MAPGFTLTFSVTGDEALARVLTPDLEEQLEAMPSVGAATAVPASQQNEAAPFLLVELSPERLWTPFYGRATVNAQVYFAYDGDAPWPLDEAVVFDTSPAVKAHGEFTVVDTSWGLISKPAYNEHLARALAKAVATALEEQVLTLP